MDIKKIRESKGMSRYRLAKELKVAYQTVVMWEKGVYKPNEINFKRLCEILGLDP